MSPMQSVRADGGRLRAVMNVVANWGAFAISAVVSFLLSPYVVHSLGNDAYGIWVLISSLVGYLGLLDLGVRGAVTKFVATHHAAANHAAASRIASAAFVVFGLAGIVAIVVSALIARFGLGLFEVSPEYADVAGPVLVLGGVTIAITIVGGVFGGIVVARQRFDLVNSSAVAITFLRAIAVVITLEAGGGLFELAVVQLGVSVLQSLVSILLSRYVYPELHVRPTRFASVDLRIILSFGLYSTLLNLASTLVLYSDTLIIGAYLPVALITFYAIATNLIDYTRNLVSGISTTITPLTSALAGAQEMGRVTEAMITGGRYATLVCLPIAITFLLRGHSFIGLWMGPEYAGPAGDVLVVLTLGLLSSSPLQICTATMIGINRHAKMVPAFLAEAVVNVVLSIALIPHYGILGVALGTLVPRLAIALGFGPWYARRVVGVRISSFLGRTLLRPALSMIPFALASWLIERGWPASNLLEFFSQVALAMPAALVGVWFVFFSEEERRDYSRTLRQRLGAVRT